MKGIERLQVKALEIEGAIGKAENAQRDLKLQVASQSDPAWIELALIKGLGLVPEGYTKIYYKEAKAK